MYIFVFLMPRKSGTCHIQDQEPAISRPRLQARTFPVRGLGCNKYFPPAFPCQGVAVYPRYSPDSESKFRFFKFSGSQVSKSSSFLVSKFPNFSGSQLHNFSALQVFNFQAFKFSCFQVFLLFSSFKVSEFSGFAFSSPPFLLSSSSQVIRVGILLIRFVRCDFFFRSG